MNTIKFSLDQIFGNYHNSSSSNPEMNILGNFLTGNASHNTSLFKTYALNDSAIAPHSNAIALQKENGYILLTDLCSTEENPPKLTMTSEQFVQILADWEEKVLKVKPAEIIIKHENDQFVIEDMTTITSEVEKEEEKKEEFDLNSYIITPHAYPQWIKGSFIFCFILFFISLFDFPYYFKINKPVQKAHKAFMDENYAQASIYFEKLSKKLPNNKYMKRYRAQCLFKSDDIEDHITALRLLSTIELDRHEWSELLDYMPSEYNAYFKRTKRTYKCCLYPTN